MNCYHKIWQKNVYRTCAGNCDEIASVTTFHRNDKNRTASVKTSCHRERSANCHGERPCASWHLGSCHYERSEVIQKQMLLASRLLLSLRSIAMTISGLSSRTQCGDLLARRLLLSLRSIAMTISGLSSRTQCGDLLARTSG